MTTAGAEQLSEILERVKDWSPPSRITLARRILESLDPSVDGATPAGSRSEMTTRGVPVESIIGLLKTDAPPPTDEECRAILEEELIKKHLR